MGLEVLLYQLFKLFVVLTNPLHQFLEELVSTRPILVGVHHLDQGLLLFVVANELNPFAFMVDLTYSHLLQKQLSIVLSILTLSNLFVAMLLFLPPLLLFQDVLGKFEKPVVVV